MNKLLLWLVIILPFFCITCQKEVVESQRYPRVGTLDVVDVTSEGATFRGDILSLGHSEIIEQGFIWDTIANLSYEYSEKIILKGTNHPGLFKQRINSSLLKNRTYFVKAFLRTKDYLVLGDVVDFVSKGSIPPAIKSISPDYGHWGDTVIIRGERFNSKSNIVLFGQIEANLIENSDTLLRVIVPSKKNDLKTTINFATPDGIVNTEALFNYLVPEISDFYPKSGTFGDLVEIEGAHLAGKPSLFHWFLAHQAIPAQIAGKALLIDPYLAIPFFYLHAKILTIEASPLCPSPSSKLTIISVASIIFKFLKSCFNSSNSKSMDKSLGPPEDLPN